MKKEKMSCEFTGALARFIVGTHISDIPAEVYEHAKVAFLDWCGCAIAGVDDPVVEKLIRYANMMGGESQATVIGKNVRKTVTQAALINGAASHVLDYDDTSTRYIGHPSVGIFPALLALGEWKGARGREFLASFVIAYKVAAVMGTCVGMKQYHRGWHTTSTIGHIASAAGAARLLGLDEDRTVAALGIAGTMSSGVKIVFGTMTKAFHAGNACRAGIMAALLARDGFGCARDFFEGPMGYFHVHGGIIREEELATLGTTWNFDELVPKFHASCHFTHSAIEALLTLSREWNISPPEVDSIYVYVSSLARDAAGKRRPQSGLEGKFSIFYCLANVLLRGDTGLQAFTDERVMDPQVISFMDKIHLCVDEKLAPMESRVIVKTVEGEMYTKSSDIFREIPSFEERKEKIIHKFLSLCEYTGRTNGLSVVETVLDLERMGSMDRLFPLL